MVRPAIRVCRRSNEGNRASDVAQRPQRKRQVKHRGNAGVPSKAERQIVVAPGLEQGQRAFQMILRFAILSGEPTRESRRRDGQRRPPGKSGLASTSLRKASACALASRQLAAQVAAGPQAVIGRQVVRARSFRQTPTRALWRKLPSFPARRSRAPRSARCRRRRAIASAAAAARPAALTSSVSASAASSACASAISGISGVGAKPSSAGARTAWASAGRAVD